MFTLIFFPIYITLTSTIDAFLPDDEVLVTHNQFVVAREELIDATPTDFWLFGTPLTILMETGQHTDNRHLINMLVAIRRFPNLLSCLDDDEQETIDITRLNTSAFHTRQDIEVCAWHAASYLETQDRLALWLSALGFEVTSDRVSGFVFWYRHEETRWISAHWRGGAEWISIPMSRSFRWKHFGFYSFGLQFVRASDGRVLQVRLQINYL